MTTRQCFRLIVLLSLVGRAVSFSASPPPPSSGTRSSDNHKPPNKKLKSPPRDFAVPFTGQIKRARSARDAIGVIARIERQGYHPNMFHYSAIINKCAKEKLVDKALGLLKRMINQGGTPNAVVLCTVIDACAKAGRHKYAISLLNDMEDKYGVKPTVKCFSAAIASCEKARKWQEAVKLLRMMTKKGVKPNVVVYSSVISACEKFAEWEKALEFLAEMEEVNIPPNVYSYAGAISACEKGRQPDIALSLLTQMKNEGIRPNVVSYSSTISACEKGGVKYTETALSLFSEMKKSGINPDDVTHRVITQACFDSKRYPEALRLAREAACLSFKEQSLRMNVSTKSRVPKWDLHELPEATACMLLADALLVFVRTGNEGTRPKYQDIIVVTGKGLNTENPNGPVLKEKIPAFLNDVAGLETAAIEENEGRFLITAASLEEWTTSGACEKFKGLFQRRQKNE